MPNETPQKRTFSLHESLSCASEAIVQLLADQSNSEIRDALELNDEALVQLQADLRYYSDQTKESVERGLQQAEAGKTHDLGSFDRYSLDSITLFRDLHIGDKFELFYDDTVEYVRTEGGYNAQTTRSFVPGYCNFCDETQVVKIPQGVPYSGPVK